MTQDTGRCDLIRTLARVVPAEPGKPDRPEATSSQATSRALAENPALWTPELARATVTRYAGLAAEWNGERGGYRPLPLADALQRGGPYRDGLCVEPGGGTGLLTPLLAQVWSRVFSLDLSPDMLAQSTAPWRARADASRLPVASGVAAAVVLGDVPLFAEEVVRVLAGDGVVVWSNALGTGAPHHVPVPVVLAALQRVTATGTWSAVTAEAGWGLWAVLRRQSP